MRPKNQNPKNSNFPVDSYVSKFGETKRDMISGLIYCESVGNKNSKSGAKSYSKTESKNSIKETLSPGGRVNHESLQTKKRIGKLNAANPRMKIVNTF